MKPLYLVAIIASVVKAVTVGPKATLTIGNAKIAPDGYARSAALVNGLHPGPTIVGQKGDTFRLNVVNNLNDPTMLRGTSIHWHGIFQRSRSWADGPVGITQCPISPGHAFEYQFSVPDQAGTYWYHSHFGEQYCDGVRGPLVVYDPRDPHLGLYDVDDESTIITLSDWYHAATPALGAIPRCDSTLINGQGRSPGGTAAPLAIISVRQNKRYRMRLISLSCDPNYMFSIDGHQLTVIEADGENVKPVTVDQLQIFTGQRYSFILNASKTPSNYWVRAFPNVCNPLLLSGSGTQSNGMNSAILRYIGAPVADPTTTQLPSPVILQETSLHPLDSANAAAPGKPFPGGADVSKNLLLEFNQGKFSINDAAGITASGFFDLLPRNQTIELTIPTGTTPGGPHPFHLHGHLFSVIRSANTANTSLNYVNPVRRDVVSLGESALSPPGSPNNVTIRFRTDNPGPWVLHCHIEFHLEAGFAIVFAEQFDSLAASTPPTSWDDLCPTYDALPASATAIQAA